MKKPIKRAGAAVPTVLLALGAGAVSVGIGMVHLPAGIIAAGVLSVVAALLLILGGDRP